MHPLQQQQQPSFAAFLSSSSPSFFPPQCGLGSFNNSPSLPFNSFPADHNQEERPRSWSQLLLSGLTGEEDRFGQTHHFQHKKLKNWAEDQILNSNSNNNPSHGVLSPADHVKQELVSQNSTNNNQLIYSYEEFQAVLRPEAAAAAASWTQVAVNMPASSPRSCVTSLGSSSNILDFSYNQTTTDHHGRNNHTNNQLPDQSSECNSTATGRVCKKARGQSSSNQPPLKVRKEKLGDRITALHQLVSPFGKTDTAPVLLEAIGYIRFLQSQIEENSILKKCWSRLVPHHIEFFSWLALRDRIATREFLRKRNMLATDQSGCALCNETEESSTHLLMHCRVTHCIWDYVLGWAGIAWAIPGSLGDLWMSWNWLLRGQRKQIQEMWNMLIYVVIWAVWTQRNQVVFRQRQFSEQRMVHRIFSLWHSWLKHRDPTFPYSAGQMLASSVWLFVWSDNG